MMGSREVFLSFRNITTAQVSTTNRRQSCWNRNFSFSSHRAFHRLINYIPLLLVLANLTYSESPDNHR